MELAAMGEEYEVDEMHPVYPILLGYRARKVLGGVSTTLSRLRKIHAKLYREAKQYVDKSQDWPLTGKVWICPVCGHTYVGEGAPEKCPVCGAGKKAYIGF